LEGALSVCVRLEQVLGKLARVPKEGGDAFRFAESVRIAPSKVIKKPGRRELLEAARDRRLGKTSRLLYRSNARSTWPLEEDNDHLERAVLTKCREQRRCPSGHLSSYSKLE